MLTLVKLSREYSVVEKKINELTDKEIEIANRILDKIKRAK